MTGKCSGVGIVLNAPSWHACHFLIPGLAHLTHLKKDGRLEYHYQFFIFAFKTLLFARAVSELQHHVRVGTSPVYAGVAFTLHEQM